MKGLTYALECAGCTALSHVPHEAQSRGIMYALPVDATGPDFNLAASQVLEWLTADPAFLSRSFLVYQLETRDMDAAYLSIRFYYHQ